MKLILLLLLVSVAACVCTLLFFMQRARNKRLLLNAVRPAGSDVPDDIGISVLCSGVFDPVQVENLLSSEYARYEVIVVLDGHSQATEFSILAASYRIIRVEWANSGELDVTGVRSLGRSRKRRFRRLVLIDRAYDGSAGDFDAAASVATYDYLLPVRSGQYLLPGTIECLVAELGGEPSHSIDAVRSLLGEPAVLLSREAVIAAGGFEMQPLREIPCARKRVLWEPLLTAPVSGFRIPAYLKLSLALLLVVAFGGAVIMGWWMVSAALVTVGLVWAGAAYASRLLVEMVPSANVNLLSRRRLSRN